MTHPHLVNDPKTLVADAMRGLVATTEDLCWHSDAGYLTRREPLPSGQVAVLSGGGSGHEPMHAGFIGAGLLTGACPGLIFTSPNALQVRAATQAVQVGGGVVHVVKNYTGDVMNFRIAADLVAEDGIEVETVLVADDVASEREDDSGPGRRGTAATMVVEKICGAAAERGDSLATVANFGRRVAEGVRSMAVALRPCTLPGTDEPSFDLPPGQIEIGIGIHGERGTDRVPAMAAHDLVRRLTDTVLSALEVQPGDQVIAIVNGLGATPALELQLLFGELADYLDQREVKVKRGLVGSLVTALDMAGASITLVRCDEEILELWDAPTSAPGWPNAPARSFPGVPQRDDGQAESTVAPIEDGSPVIPDEPGVLGRAGVADWMSRWISRMLSEEQALTKLDRQAGDGDFGTNMAAALQRVDLDGVRDTYSPAAVFGAVSDAYLGYAGGTSGALFGIWFRHFFRAAQDAAPRGLDLAALTAAARAGLDAIRELGGAVPGDKTLVDTLDPAVTTLEEATDAGLELDQAVAKASEAAEQGAESTVEITANRGRASYIGDAARGVTDPGALAMAWFFAELRG